MEQNSIQLDVLKEFSEKDAESIRALTTMIGDNAMLVTDEEVKAMLADSNMYLHIARDSQTNRIVGMLTQIIYRIPYAKKSYLDDIIVDENYRGKGIGSQLLEQAITNAKNHQTKFVELTSNPRRISGIKLYEKFGFKQRETNVYRFDLK